MLNPLNVNAWIPSTVRGHFLFRRDLLEYPTKSSHAGPWPLHPGIKPGQCHSAIGHSRAILVNHKQRHLKERQGAEGEEKSEGQTDWLGGGLNVEADKVFMLLEPTPHNHPQPPQTFPTLSSSIFQL